MTIDLKNPQNLTTDTVRELIASGDDSSNTAGALSSPRTDFIHLEIS